MIKWPDYILYMAYIYICNFRYDSCNWELNAPQNTYFIQILYLAYIWGQKYTSLCMHILLYAHTRKRTFCMHRPIYHTYTHTRCGHFSLDVNWVTGQRRAERCGAWVVCKCAGATDCWCILTDLHLSPPNISSISRTRRIFLLSDAWAPTIAFG